MNQIKNNQSVRQLMDAFNWAVEGAVDRSVSDAVYWPVRCSVYWPVRWSVFDDVSNVSDNDVNWPVSDTVRDLR